MSATFGYAGRYEIKRAVINEATLGDRTIVAAVSGKKLVVVNLVVEFTSGAVAVTWKSATTAISGVMPSSYQARDADAGILETAVGAALVLNLSAAADVDGHLSYAEV